ncbi:MAG: hypothetical protein WCW40_08880 [Bacteroidota bacterium]
MKNSLASLLLLAAVLLTGCTPQQLLVHNNYQENVQLLYQVPYTPEPYTVHIGLVKDTVISFQEIPTAGGDLMLIIVQRGAGSEPDYYRFSGSYLLSRKSGINIPFTLSDTVKFMPQSLVQKIYAVEEHTHYFLVQELYNAKRYVECINVIESMSVVQVNNSPYQEVRGMAVLAYLSAMKLKMGGKADSYWKMVEKGSTGYSQYLQNHDVELAKMRIDH